MLYFARGSLFLINFCPIGFLFFFLLNLILPLSNSLYISLLCHLFQRLPHLPTFPFGFFICCFTWGILLTHRTQLPPAMHINDPSSFPLANPGLLHFSIFLLPLRSGHLHTKMRSVCPRHTVVLHKTVYH